MKAVLQKGIDESVVKEMTVAACCGRDGCIATVKRSATHVLREFSLLVPIEDVVEKGKKL